MKFFFSVPHPAGRLSAEAQAAIQLAALAGRLAVEERTIVYNTDGRPESVAEHSAMLAIVAPALAEEFFPELDANSIARYAAIHDILEAYVGDTPTHRIDEAGLKAKAKREASAFSKLKAEYAHLPKFVARITEYEAQQIPEARFVRMVDKLMPLLVHINDSGTGLRSQQFDADEIRANSAERSTTFLADYPELAPIINLRAELAEHVASMLERD